ncbi:MAG: leucine-rich repeat protein [Coriobacteriales bacterium]|jgi:hypothetical protein|nr:leucine-rich repeat protein [Coriobacteriales bacterium]
MSKTKERDVVVVRWLKKVLSILLVVLLSAGMVPALPEVALATGVDSDMRNEAEPQSPGMTGEMIADVINEIGLINTLGNSSSTQADPIFQFTIEIPDYLDYFVLPTSSALNSYSTSKGYNWMISWGDGSAEYVFGLSSMYGGIPHKYAATGAYTITIRPVGSTEAWLAAFGFNAFTTNYLSANNPINRSMVTGILSPLTPEMTRSTAQIIGTEAAPDREWSESFYGCTNLVLAPVFQGWDRFSSVGNWFALHMFNQCTSLATLPECFNLPEAITEAGDGFATAMFANCTQLTRLPVDFNMPQGLVKVGSSFASSLFASCTSLSTLPAGFNLPQGITSTGSAFAAGMFEGCSSLVALPEGFNLPPNIRDVGFHFASSIFSECSSLVTLPDGFNLPQNITSADSYYAYYMFAYCESLYALPEGFNIPQSIVEVGDVFAGCMFNGCKSLKSLPSGFNLPQDITEVGRDFAYSMFRDCTSLDALPPGFNLPQGITSAGSFFVDSMFYMAGSPSFQINDEFSIPAGIPVDVYRAFFGAFLLSEFSPTQNRTATSIIGNCPTPESPRETFDSHFSDIDYVPINWGGGGQTLPGVGAPGSGDLWGTGTVTMDVALVIARVVTGGGMQLTPEQFAAVDMDFDGYLTMADVILIMRKASGI